MGLFGMIKNMAQGTFGLIPRNWTYVYLRLYQGHREQFYSPEAIMVAASIINAAPYISTGRLTINDFRESLLYAKLGRCGPTSSSQDEAFTWHIPHASFASFANNGEASHELIVNYCIQYTSVLLAADTPKFDIRSIVAACVDKKLRIEKNIIALNQELSRGMSNSYLWNLNVAREMEPGASTEITPYLKGLVKKSTGAKNKKWRESGSNFKAELFSISKLIGCSSDVLYKQLGECDEIDEDEHRTYAWFNDSKSSFFIKSNDRVQAVSSPISSSFGGPYLDEPDFFTIDGVKQGISKNDVERLWGKPDSSGLLAWTYKKRGGTTTSGQKFQLSVCFEEVGHAHQVTHFTTALIS